MTCDSLGERLNAAVRSGLPAAVSDAAKRALLSASTTAVSAVRAGVAPALLALAERHGGAKAAPIAGTATRSDPYHAALINGSASADAVFGAFVAMLESSALDGRRALTAYAAGRETQVRLKNALSPQTGEGAWDLDAVCGVISATVTAGLLLSLDAEQLADAVGIAASETLGHGRGRGTDMEAFHAGKAASNGVIAAMFARHGFTGSRSLDAYAGFFTVFPPAVPGAAGAWAGDFGERWEFASGSPPGAGDARASALAAAIRHLDERHSGAEFLVALTEANAEQRR